MGRSATAASVSLGDGERKGRGIGGFYATVWRKYQIHVPLEIQGPENPINGRGSPIGTKTTGPARDNETSRCKWQPVKLGICCRAALQATVMS